MAAFRVGAFRFGAFRFDASLFASISFRFAPRPRALASAAASVRAAPAPTVYANTQLTAALVGRPNVGKSTLFNRLAAAVRGRHAEHPLASPPLTFVRSVVHPLPGVTRDSRRATAALADLLLTVVDTPGLEDAVQPSALPSDHLPPPAADREPASLVSAVAHCPDAAYRRVYARMREATVQAVSNANLILFIVDASAPLTALDHAHAKWLRSCLTPSKNIILVANKCDVAQSEHRAIDAYALGFGDPVLISAEQALGFADLYERIRVLSKSLPGVQTKQQLVEQPVAQQPVQQPTSAVASQPQQLHPEEAAIRESFDDELVITTSARLRERPLDHLITSIIGRPNVGKSTLLNSLVGEERSIVGAAAGITRDAVLCPWRVPFPQSAQPPVWLVDTPGVRAETKVTPDQLERLMVRASLQALRTSHVVVVVIDATESLTRQDVKLLDVVVTEGRAAVLVVNKMDKVDVPNLDQWRAELRYTVDHKLEQLKGIEVVEMSAIHCNKDSSQAQRLYAAVQRTRGRWEKRIPTSALNRFVKGFNERMAVGGGTQGERRNRVGVTKFITQKKIRPPMFRLDGSSAVSINYLRALTNAIRHEFGYEGVPIRVKRPSRRRRR